MDASTTSPLKDRLRGAVLDAHHPDYDDVRALYNGMIDKRPRLIARCVDAADVLAAVKYAREADLLVAIRGGGHSAAGQSSCDDGLMIDLSLMRSVRVDPKNETVRVEGAVQALMSITPPKLLALPCPRGPYRARVSRVSPLAAVMAISPGSMD